jgi:hypothetical protein
MALAVVALAATALMATATSAVPEGEIVIHGPD